MDKSLINRRGWILGAGAVLLAGAGDAAAPARAEISRLRRRAEILLRKLGAWRGDVAADIARFMEAPAGLYPDDAGGRAAAVADMARRFETARPLLAPAFDMALPGAAFRCLTPEEEKAKRGGHRTADGYVVDLTAIRTRPAWTLPSVVFHETVPGHLLQTTVRDGRDPAFAEGWATYAEQVACELGVYRDDPAGELGYIHWRLFRMARIVADVGLSSRGWSDAQGLRALKDIQGAPIAFATFEMDVGRMRRTPGAYAAQGLTALRIRAERPRRRLDWARYHRGVLTA